MSGTIAKKYVNALFKSCDDAQIKSIDSALEGLLDAFKIPKFTTIIQSPDISLVDKETLLLSLVENKEAKFTHFIKLLCANNRLALIPLIAKELQYQLSLKNNVFEGEVMSNFKVTAAQLKTMEENFGKKFNAHIKLHASKNSYPGIKIALDDLGVEVSFSLDRLKAQMSEHILKAI